MHATKTEPPADLLYGVPAISAHLGIRLQQAHHQIRKGALPTFRVGGVICARKSTIAAWIAKQEADALKPKPPEFTPPGDLPPLHTRSAEPRA